MAATNRSIDYDALLTTTAEFYHKSGVLQDGIFESNIVVKTLREKGFKEEAIGGSKIQTNVMYGKNSAAKSYSRYEQLDVSPQDGMTAAFYDWAQAAVPVSIDGLSKFQNSSKPAIQNLLKEKVEQATMSASEMQNEQLMDVTNDAASTGNGGKNLISIPNLVKYTPTSGSVGGIDQAAEAWWRNKTKTSAASSFDTLSQEMRTMYNDCSRGTGGLPDIIICDQTTYETYENGMDRKIQYAYTDDASVGFESIKFKAAKMYWDIAVPDAANSKNFDQSPTKGTMYFLNSKFLQFVCGKGFDWAPQGFRTPVDQDASTSLYLFYGQLIANNLRKHGVIGNISTGITT